MVAYESCNACLWREQPLVPRKGILSVKIVAYGDSRIDLVAKEGD